MLIIPFGRQETQYFRFNFISTTPLVRPDMLNTPFDRGTIRGRTGMAPLTVSSLKAMIVSKPIASASFLLFTTLFLSTLTGFTNGQTLCEAEDETDGRIGWCMNQYNPTDRSNCPLATYDWADPEEGDCPNDTDVLNPLNLTVDTG
jgi:hypothetical protein